MTRRFVKNERTPDCISPILRKETSASVTCNSLSSLMTGFSIHRLIQGFSKSSLTLGLNSEFFVRHYLQNSLASDEISPHKSYGYSTSDSIIYLLTSSSVDPLNAGVPVSNMYVIHPRLHTSTFSSYFYSFISSGDMYNGLPSAISILS